MRRFYLALVALCCATTAASNHAAVDDPKPDNKLVGTWKLASGKYNGQDAQFREGSTYIKHITPTHFMWVTYDKDGSVQRTAGGTYTLEGDKYTEMPEYGMAPTSTSSRATPSRSRARSKATSGITTAS